MKVAELINTTNTKFDFYQEIHNDIGKMSVSAVIYTKFIRKIDSLESEFLSVENIGDIVSNKTYFQKFSLTEKQLDLDIDIDLFCIIKKHINLNKKVNEIIKFEGIHKIELHFGY